MLKPENIQLIGDEVAIVWNDGGESYFPMAFLRKKSPSAENIGETDIFGQTYGGTPSADHTGVRVVDYEYVGNYALRLSFSDGHRTGLYSFKYLRTLNPD